MEKNKEEEKSLQKPLISRKKQLYFDIAVVVLFLGLSIGLIWVYHNGDAPKEFAYSLLIGLCGLTIGWLIGILSTPFSGEELQLSVFFQDTS